MNEQEEKPYREKTEVDKILDERDTFNGWMAFQHSRRFDLTMLRRDRITGEYR